MVWIKILLIVSFLWINGCASSRGAQGKRLEPMTMKDIYLSSNGSSQKNTSNFIEKNLKERKSSGYVKPYIPIVNDPVVRKVWVPDHKASDNSDVLIAGHWVYVMVQPTSWFIDGQVVTSQMPAIVSSLDETGLELKTKKD